MPIDVKKVVEKGKELNKPKNNGQFQEKVLGYLRDHKEQAFTQQEIVDALNLDDKKNPQVNQTLWALLNKNLVKRYQVETKEGQRMVWMSNVK